MALSKRVPQDESLRFNGNLGGDPVMRHLNDGTKVCDFSVGAPRSFKNKGTGQWVNKTIWYKVTVWRDQAEWVNTNLHKGDRVTIIGDLTPDENGNPRIWEGSDAKPHASYEVRATRVIQWDREANGTREREEGASYTPPVNNDDDLPF
jgi:single stranded DNA-binding protein